MDAIPNNTPALLNRIDSLRNSLIKRFENLIELASMEKTDRNTTALHSYQVQVETASLVRATEELLSLIRRMQELWLFGQLNTLQADREHDKLDAQATEIANILQELVKLNENNASSVAA